VAKYQWTQHARWKMRYYGISEGRVKRIVRYPARTEEGIISGCVAVMQVAGTKKHTEIWVMHKVAGEQIRIITAWRYPGISPKRDPVPKGVLEEIRSLV
jgi:hypothetical protein